MGAGRLGVRAYVRHESIGYSSDNAISDVIARLLNLPIHPDYTDEQIRYLAESVAAVAEGA